MQSYAAPCSTPYRLRDDTYSLLNLTSIFSLNFELRSLSVHEAILLFDSGNRLHPSSPKRLGELSMDPERACMIR
jgi:hypothetical protein